jgi:hypothetical protein
MRKSFLRQKPPGLLRNIKIFHKNGTRVGAGDHPGTEIVRLLDEEEGVLTTSVIAFTIPRSEGASSENPWRLAA